jgi:hypothetical protein
LSNGENDEEFIYELCSKFLDIIKQYIWLFFKFWFKFKTKIIIRSSSYTRVKEKNINFNDDGEIKQLSAPVQISNWLDNDPENSKKQKESIFDLKKDDITFVDSKKLEKVEAKLLKKNEKREGKSTDNNNSSYDASKSASASQAISRKAENFNDTGNRTFDVVIENFDVSFGNK